MTDHHLVEVQFYELHRAIGRMEGKMDLIIERLDADRNQDGDRDKRIIALEKAGARHAAVAALLAFIISVIGPLIIGYFQIT